MITELDSLQRCLAVASALSKSPTTQPPPWNHTKTGRDVSSEGVYIRAGIGPASEGIFMSSTLCTSGPFPRGRALALDLAS